MDGTDEWEDRRLAATRCQLDLLIGFALAEDHGKREQEEDDSPRDLKRCEWNVHGSKDDFPRDNEENQDNRRYQSRFDCDFSLELLIISAGDGDEYRHRSDGVDHGKEEDECCDDIAH